jgi:hypothetical protein
MERSGMRNLIAITSNAGRNEKRKNKTKNKRQRSITGGCCLSEPNAECNGA